MAISKFNISFSKDRIEKLPFPEKGRVTYRDQRIPYLLLRVSAKNKVFAYTRKISGKKVQHTIGKFPTTTFKFAVSEVTRLNEKYRVGENVREIINAAKAEITLGELWEDFRLNRPRGGGKISKSYEYIWERHFKVWEDKQMSDITYDMCYNLIVKQLRPSGPIHGNRVQRFGKALWNFAIRQRRLQIENHWTFAEYSEKEHSRKSYRLLPTDMVAFKMALEVLSPAMRTLFWTTLLSGRRIGECCKMRWAEIDLETGYWGNHDTKTGTQYTTLSPVVCNLLREYKAEVEPTSQWVFPAHSKQGHVVSYNNAWSKVRAQGFKHLNANDLRGTLASWASDLNVPVGAISQQLGHADISTTLNKYVRVSDDSQRLEIDKVGRAMLMASKPPVKKSE